MGFSSFVVLGFMGGEIAVILVQKFSVPIDCVTFLVLLFNFAVVGVMSIFMSKMAILITQSYLVVIGMLVAYWFTLLPEWTTWALLVAMALYDLAAVLLPGGPLRLLVELAISRDEEIPALVYEARPITNNNVGPMQRVVERRSWKGRRSADPDTAESSNASSSLGVLLSSEDRQNETRVVIAQESQVSGDSELSAPLIPQEMVQSESWPMDGIGLGSSGAIKLGLGDFIFYSVLVGRAAMYDFMTVYACYLAIIAGLGITLMLLAFYQKALPALPVSILLGVVFYFLTRILLEIFVVQCSVNLFMF
ncbi:hypothetical protein IFM89_038492 [Coptis chinensis]|uniref:Presenilin n=1 Tax=Coptis chinensis TaxID=261450 RepID=A0A835J002_9MAGN|nr:hypothetical protein IFM89_038492 [Coptis chinensis]